jgi:hypothetical protein
VIRRGELIGQMRVLEIKLTSVEYEAGVVRRSLASLLDRLEGSMPEWRDYERGLRGARGE